MQGASQRSRGADLPSHIRRKIYLCWAGVLGQGSAGERAMCGSRGRSGPLHLAMCMSVPRAGDGRYHRAAAARSSRNVAFGLPVEERIDAGLHS
jgi:hypothetical protein